MSTTETRPRGPKAPPQQRGALLAVFDRPQYNEQIRLSLERRGHGQHAVVLRTWGPGRTDSGYWPTPRSIGIQLRELDQLIASLRRAQILAEADLAVGPDGEDRRRIDICDGRHA